MNFDLNENEVKLREELSEYLRNKKEGELLQTFIKDEINDVLYSPTTTFVSKVTALIEITKAFPSLSIGLLDTIVSANTFYKNSSKRLNISFAFTEELAGSDLTMIETQARKSSDGWIVTGEKNYVLFSEHTDELIVLAKTEQNSYGLFSIPVNQEKVMIELEEVMGLSEISNSKIVLDNVHASESQLLLNIDSSFEQLKETFLLNTLFVAAVAVGTSEEALNQALDYSRTRKQFGSIIGDFQAIQFKVAEMTVGINAAKVLLYEAAQKFHRDELADAEISMSKVYATEVAKNVVNHTVQIHGSSAILSNSRIAKLYQSQRLLEIYGQTSEVLRLKIADSLINSN